MPGQGKKPVAKNGSPDVAAPQQKKAQPKKLQPNKADMEPEVVESAAEQRWGSFPVEPEALDVAAGEAPCTSKAAAADSAEGSCTKPELLQGGGSGEAPLQENAPGIAVEAPAPVRWSDDANGADILRCEEPAKGEEDVRISSAEIAGDYRWTDPDDGVECILRMRSTGEWWHAAHRQTIERGKIVDKAQKDKKKQKLVNIHKAYKEHGTAYEEDETVDDLKSLKADYEEFEIWELVETTGCWREVQVSVADGASYKARMGVLLTCRSSNWKTNFPNAPLVFCPPSKDRQDEVDSMLDSGNMVLCFVHHAACDENRGSGGRLELHMDLSTVSEWTGAVMQEIPRHTRNRTMQTAFQMLGFARTYATKAAAALQVLEEHNF